MLWSFSWLSIGILLFGQMELDHHPLSKFSRIIWIGKTQKFDQPGPYEVSSQVRPPWLPCSPFATGATTLGQTTLCLATLSITIKRTSQHIQQRSDAERRILKLCLCRYAECRCVECRGAPKWIKVGKHSRMESARWRLPVKCLAGKTLQKIFIFLAVRRPAPPVRRRRNVNPWPLGWRG